MTDHLDVNLHRVRQLKGLPTWRETRTNMQLSLVPRRPPIQSVHPENECAFKLADLRLKMVMFSTSVGSRQKVRHLSKRLQSVARC